MGVETVIHKQIPKDSGDDSVRVSVDSMTFVLFGGTGDLAKRKIFPALLNLYLTNKLPSSFLVIGIGRSPLTNEEFQARVTDSLYTYSRHLIKDHTLKKQFVQKFRYFQLDILDGGGYKGLLTHVEKSEKELGLMENRLFYLSVSPEFFEIITTKIKESGLSGNKGWKRLLIEKPFGHDLASAKTLNQQLSQVFEEDEIYRIDHYLGKPMVQNLEALVHANPILQSLWNNKYIANVQITASETVGLEGRAGYYDQSGALRDMVQNHMLQLVMMSAMDLQEYSAKDKIRERKRSVIDSFRVYEKEEIVHQIVRGQYVNGMINEKKVLGYLDEPGITENSTNDTFIAARLWIDNPSWEGVPFFIRTGKRMAEKSTRIVIEFKNPLKEVLKNNMDQLFPNLLIIIINPNEGITLQLNSKNPMSGQIEPISVDFSESKMGIPEAYEFLIMDAMKGESTYFAHWKEVELAWKWTQPILDAFHEKLVPLHTYSAGSMGPEAANELLMKEGYHWW